MVNVFGIVGWKNNGKTTLVVKLVAKLTERGYCVGTVKHAHHDFDIDEENTDSWRHRKAGAREVAIVSSRRWAIIHELKDEAEPSLAMVLSRMSRCDLILVEGYKNESHKKLEVRRQGGKVGEALYLKDRNIVAIASDKIETESHLPLFDLNDIEAIANFIELEAGLKENHDA